MKASAIDTAVRQILQDPSSLHWTAANLLEWIHEGELETVAAAPRAGASTVTLDLTQDQCQQTLAATYLGLLDISVNLGVNGTTYGRSITRTSLDQLQAIKPTWRADRATAVRHFIQDERDTHLYYVWPGPSLAIKVEARAVVMPTLHAALSDDLTVADEWKNALVEYALYKAFSKDANDTENLQRAAAHYAVFARLVGIKVDKRAKAGPGGNSPVNPAYPVVEKNGA